jgi:hypothetical protein
MTVPLDGRTRFRLLPDVVVEAFPDETIAVNLASGRYYSVDPVGGEVLARLTSGRTWDAVLLELRARFHGNEDAIEATATEFTEQLITEGLIAIDGALPAPDDFESVPTTAPGTAFAPSIVVFSDMQDLLLLDPIHDVDATGWPVRADGGGQPPRDRT